MESKRGLESIPELQFITNCDKDHEMPHVAIWTKEGPLHFFWCHKCKQAKFVIEPDRVKWEKHKSRLIVRFFDWLFNVW